MMVSELAPLVSRTSDKVKDKVSVVTGGRMMASCSRRASRMLKGALASVTAALRSGTARQYAAASAASLSVLVAGWAFTWVTQLLSALTGPHSEVPMTREQSSWVVSLIEVGNFLTPIPAGLLVDSWGRKPCLLLAAPLFAVSWLLVITTRRVAMLYLVRFLQGVGMGVIFTVLPTYLGEISEARHRGTLGTLFEVGWYLGVVLQYCAAPLLSYHALALLSLAGPLVYLVLFSLVPETPHFLLMAGRPKEAAQALSWLRGDQSSVDVDEELKAMKVSVDEDLARRTSSAWLDLVSTPGYRRSLLVVQVVVLMEVVSGIPAVLSYVTEALEGTNDHSLLQADQYTIIIGVCILVSTAFSAVAVDRVGRRPILLASGLGAAVCQLLSGLYFYADSTAGVSLTGLSWVPAACISLYGVLLCGGCGAVSTVVQSELFPAHTRGLANGVVTTVMNLGSFLCLKLYEEVRLAYGIYLNFWLYSACGLLGSLFIYIYLPETKGRTFDQIQRMMAELSRSGKVDPLEQRNVKAV